MREGKNSAIPRAMVNFSPCFRDFGEGREGREGFITPRAQGRAQEPGENPPNLPYPSLNSPFRDAVSWRCQTITIGALRQVPMASPGSPAQSNHPMSWGIPHELA